MAKLQYLRIQIFLICGLEMVWYFYGMGISWYGIGNKYYNWIMRLTDEPFTYDQISNYCSGIIVYVLSFWCTLALFYVAWTDGDCKGKYLFRIQ